MERFAWPSCVDESHVSLWRFFCVLFAALLRLLVEGFVDELDALHDVENRNLILIYGLCASLVCVYFLRHDTSLVLDEVKSLHHELGDCAPMYTNGQHAKHTTREAVEQTECASRAAFHVE